MKSPFRRVVIAAGLDPTKVTPHTLRHTAITDLAETGATIRTIQEFSGHTSVEMVMRYTHAREQQVDQALDKLDQRGTKRGPAKAPNRESS
jgi:integrase